MELFLRAEGSVRQCGTVAGFFRFQGQLEFKRQLCIFLDGRPGELFNLPEWVHGGINNNNSFLGVIGKSLGRKVAPQISALVTISQSVLWLWSPWVPKGLWDGCYKNVVYLLAGSITPIVLVPTQHGHLFLHWEDKWGKNSMGGLGKTSGSICVLFKTFFLSSLRSVFLPLKQSHKLNPGLRTARDIPCHWGPGAAWCPTLFMLLGTGVLIYAGHVQPCLSRYATGINCPRPSLRHITISSVGNSGDKIAQAHHQ